MADKDKDGLQDKNEALELLRDEAGKLGMTGFGRMGEEKLNKAIGEFKAAKEEPVKVKSNLPYWKRRG